MNFDDEYFSELDKVCKFNTLIVTDESVSVECKHGYMTHKIDAHHSRLAASFAVLARFRNMNHKDH